MKATIRAMCRMSYWGVAIIGLLGCYVLLIAGTADAMLTPQSANGTIEVMAAGELSWQPISSATSLRTGDQVRTMPGSSVELWFDDGSLLRLGESTQILLKDVQILQAEKSRIAKVSLAFGTITAKITKLGYTQSLCEIDTGTVLVSVKFSQATVQKFQDGSPDMVIAEQGMVDIQQIGQGEVRVAARIDGEEGMDFVLNMPGAMVSLNIQNLLRRITLISENAIAAISSLIGAYDNFLKIENLGDSSVMCDANGQRVSIFSNSQGSIGISGERGLQIETAKAAFTFQQRELQGDVLMVFNHVGKVTVNDEDVAPGSFASVPFGLTSEKGESRTLQQPEQPPAVPATQENPVVPPSVRRSQGDTPKGGGIEIIPTAQPSPSPTEIPTAEPTATPVKKKTPTPKPTAAPVTPTPAPVYTHKPGGSPGLPPQPTPTPQSPSEP